MTVTTVTPVTGQLDDAEYEARLERLCAYVEQLEEANRDADTGSLERAVDLAAIFADKRWAKDLDPPKRATWRGQPVDPEGRSRFAKWAKDHIKGRKAGLAYGRSYQLLNAYEVISLCHGRDMNLPQGVGEWALRPLTKLLRDSRTDEIPAVLRRALQFTEGETPEVTDIRKALTDHNKAMGHTATDRTTAYYQRTVKEAHAKVLREAKWIKEHGNEEDQKGLLLAIHDLFTSTPESNE